VETHILSKVAGLAKPLVDGLITLHPASQLEDHPQQQIFNIPWGVIFQVVLERNL
jgi:hypothetical protein